MNGQMLSPYHWEYLSLIMLNWSLRVPSAQNCVTSAGYHVAPSLDPLLARKFESLPPGLTPRLLAIETQFPQQEFNLPLRLVLPLRQLCVGQRLPLSRCRSTLSLPRTLRPRETPFFQIFIAPHCNKST